MWPFTRKRNLREGAVKSTPELRAKVARRQGGKLYLRKPFDTTHHWGAAAASFILARERGREDEAQAWLELIERNIEDTVYVDHQ
jgi:hypothetical protein